jgi:hypothetical protein
MNSVTIEVRTIYGNMIIYPVCEAAKTFAKIAGTKSLTEQTVKLIRELGYEVRVRVAAYDSRGVISGFASQFATA